jgi:2'-5' RNA ligase superfamily
MTSSEPASAVVVRIPVPRGLAGLRRRWDRVAGVGVPPHVTILFPFLPPNRLGPEVRRDLAAIAAAHESFEVTFSRVGRFPGLVYLEPDPSGPFLRLTEAVIARFPGFPPYGGAFDELIPHLTIAESEDAPLHEIESAVALELPIRHHVTDLEVLVEAPAGRWHRRWRLPLGQAGEHADEGLPAFRP